MIFWKAIFNTSEPTGHTWVLIKWDILTGLTLPPRNENRFSWMSISKQTFKMILRFMLVIFLKRSNKAKSKPLFLVWNALLFNFGLSTQPTWLGSPGAALRNSLKFQHVWTCLNTFNQNFSSVSSCMSHWMPKINQGIIIVYQHNLLSYLAMLTPWINITH